MFFTPIFNTPVTHPSFKEADKLMARQELIKEYSYTREAANLLKDPQKEVKMYKDLKLAKR